MSNAPGRTVDILGHILDHDIHRRVTSTSVTGACGSVVYINADGALVAVPPVDDEGYYVLRSKGTCQAPVWMDIEDLIREISGVGNRSTIIDLSLPLPTQALSYATASTTPTAYSSIRTITAPSVALSTLVSTAAAQATIRAKTITMLTVSSDATIV